MSHHITLTTLVLYIAILILAPFHLPIPPTRCTFKRSVPIQPRFTATLQDINLAMQSLSRPFYLHVQALRIIKFHTLQSPPAPLGSCSHSTHPCKLHIDLYLHIDLVTSCKRSRCTVHTSFRSYFVTSC